MIFGLCYLLSAIWHRSDVILLLGVSGAVALPLLRLLLRFGCPTQFDFL